MEKSTFRIGVYGSLRQGHYNHPILEEYGDFVGRTTLPGFDLYDLGAYPGIVPGQGTVVIEVYEVPAYVFWRLHSMERGAGYDASLVDTKFGEVTVWVYQLGVSENSKINSGDWNDHQDQF